MLVRRPGVRGPKPKPERKDFNADKTKAPKTSLSSSYQKSKVNRQALRRPGKQPQGALDLRQPSTIRDGSRPCSLPTRTRDGILPVSPRTDPQAIPPPGLDKVVANQPWQLISASSSNDHDALCGLIASKLDEVLSSIDGETFAGKEEHLCISIR